MIQLRSISTLGDKGPVLRGIDLVFPPCGVSMLIGTSGSGKSTILRALAGSEPIDSGEIAGLPRDSCLVLQEPSLWPHLSLVSNVALGLKLRRGQEHGDALRIAQRALAEMGLESFGQSAPATLSGGQAQRGAIARALVLDPELLLLDEVTSSLDPRLTHQVMQTIGEFASRKPVIMATHDLLLAREVAAFVAVIDDGQLVESGPPARVFQSPRDPRTASFVAPIMRLVGRGSRQRSALIEPVERAITSQS
ncbi:MAG: ATP-binding cassette domain-containing protein [Pseudomonadota bacterium]